MLRHVIKGSYVMLKKYNTNNNNTSNIKQIVFLITSAGEKLINSHNIMRQNLETTPKKNS